MRMSISRIGARHQVLQYTAANAGPPFNDIQIAQANPKRFFIGFYNQIGGNECGIYIPSTINSVGLVPGAISLNHDWPLEFDWPHRGALVQQEFWGTNQVDGFAICVVEVILIDDGQGSAQ